MFGWSVYVNRFLSVRSRITIVDLPGKNEITSQLRRANERSQLSIKLRQCSSWGGMYVIAALNKRSMKEIDRFTTSKKKEYERK